jgi:hypothetical protein
MIVNSVPKGDSVIILIIAIIIIGGGGGSGGGGGGGGGNDCCCFCISVTSNIDEGLSVEVCGKGSSSNLCVFLGVG